MRLILQRVSSASVEVAGDRLSKIDRGMLVLVGVEKGDSRDQVAAAVAKLAGLRIFEDESGRMNRDIRETGGAILLVSQFTLAGSLSKGRRPSFDGAARPEDAEPLIEQMAAGLRERQISVATGRFGAYMQVELVNEGPATFVLELPPERSG